MDFESIPLKDLDPVMLALAINQKIDMWDDQAKIVRAMEFAAWFHRNKRRTNATRSSNGDLNQPTSPYIVHPLRNTLRLLRWDIDDTDVLVASILHDTVEDHSEEMSKIFFEKSGGPFPLTQEIERAYALQLIEDEFGSRARHLVLLVSNPLSTDKQLSRDVKNEIYSEHLKLILGDYDVFMVKVSDFCDNALGLHHHTDSPEMNKKLATKYLLVLPHFINALRETHWGTAAHMNIKFKLSQAELYLNQIINQK